MSSTAKIARYNLYDGPLDGENVLASADAVKLKVCATTCYLDGIVFWAAARGKGEQYFKYVVTSMNGNVGEARYEG